WTSHWHTTIWADASAGWAASTSAGESRTLARSATMMALTPVVSSTQIGATPAQDSAAVATQVVSTPKEAKYLRVSSPKISWPSLVTMVTSPPSLAATTAWFAPLPPNPI